MTQKAKLCVPCIYVAIDLNLLTCEYLFACISPAACKEMDRGTFGGAFLTFGGVRTSLTQWLRFIVEVGARFRL